MYDRCDVDKKAEEYGFAHRAVVCYHSSMSIEEIQTKIRPVLDEYEVGYAGVFGSVARGDDGPDSDVDIVVSMKRPIGVYRFMELKERLEQTLGRRVDLVSQKAVNKYIRPYMERDVATVYGKG